ncbi:uncharacterized protein METZ01_LOCUS96074 [marine metagenome]|uniref:Uncharacterized protein n=1 Tax=marine metagenome TaxID=408172 RepID=A0A381VSD9_9ZZZZ
MRQWFRNSIVYSLEIALIFGFISG